MSALFVAPAALGGVHLPVVVLLFVLTGISALTGIARRVKLSTPIKISALNLALGLLSFWALVQCIPIPGGLLGILSPYVHQIWMDSSQLVGITENWHALSLQPEASADRALRFATLTLASISANNLRLRDLERRLIPFGFAAGLVISLFLGVLHRFLELHQFFGTYDPGVGPKLTTFISSNHAAAAFGLGAIVAGLRLWRSIQTSNRPTVVANSLALCIALIVVIESNSTGVFLAIGGVGLLVLLRFVATISKKYAGFFGLIILASAAMAGLFFSQPDSLQTRLELNRAALTGSVHAWCVGFGAGTTETALPKFIDWSIIQDTRLRTIETEPIEWLFTYGWLVAGIVILLLFTYLIPMRQNPNDSWSDRKSYYFLAAWIVAVYFAAISMMHFPFLALGVSLPAVVILESFQRRAYSHRRPPTHDSFVRYRQISTPIILGFTFVMIGCGALGAWISSPSQKGLKQRIFETPSDATLFATLTREEMAKDQHVQAEVFAARALELEPTARMHLLHALTLAANKRGEEAVADYLVVGQSHLAARAAREAAAILPPKLAAQAIPQDRYWREARDAAMKARGKEAGVDFALALVDEHPKSALAAQVAIETYWQRKDYDVAELWARLLIADGRADADGNPIGHGLLIQTLLKSNRIDQARTEANRAMEFVPGDPVIERAVIQLRPSKPADAQKADIEVVTTAHGLYCHSAHSGQERKFCELARAWIAEAGGDLETAEETLKGLTERFDTATPLAEFYVRTNQCAALRTLNLGWRDKPDSEKVATMAARCGVL